jgi:SAM-dependent methyltransferase
VKLDQHYVDARLVALYDGDNPRGKDTDFYLRLADRLDARRIIDLGCGTGLLTRELAVAGREVSGVDPASAMLAWARRQPGARRVRWVQGDSSVLGSAGADLALMTGNVAQVFLEDEQWNVTLRHLHGALRAGGVLAFESRNPAARAWEDWNRAATFERLDSPSGPLECWLELVAVQDGRVRFEGHNVFTATGENLVVKSELRFRSEAELTASLSSAGFRVLHVYGDWDSGSVTPASHSLIFVAQQVATG